MASNKPTINPTVIAIARQHLAQGQFGMVTLAEAIGVHHSTVYRWVKLGVEAQGKPKRTAEEELYVQLAEMKADPPLAYTAAWNAILKNLQSDDPDLNLAWKVIEQFEEALLKKLEMALAQKEAE